MRQSVVPALAFVLSFSAIAGAGLAGENRYAVVCDPNPEKVHISQRRAYVKLRELGVSCNTTKSGHVVQVIFNKHKQLPDDTLKLVREFPRVAVVSFGRAPFTDKALEHLAGLDQLDQIGISYTKITDAGLAQLAGCTNLTGINCSHVDVTDKGLKHLARLKKLRLLRLNRTKVTDAGLAHLVNSNRWAVWALRLDPTTVGVLTDEP